MDWTETPPAQLDVDPAALATAVELVESSGAVAQLCVLRDGAVLLDRTVGCRPESLFVLFSAGKPFIAMGVHLLAERGAFDLDDPVARYWPEFGAAGKDQITIRQVLQHRSGLPVAHSVWRDALTAVSWPASVRAIEQATPSYPAGAVPAYHILSYGFILGELIHRVTDIGPKEFLRAELFDPLGMADTHLGLADPIAGQALWDRHVPLRSTGNGAAARRMLFNRRVVRRAVIPAAAFSSTARDLAQFYQMLAGGGELDGVRVLQPATIAQACTPSSDGEVDRLLKVHLRWSQGFQLGGQDAGSSRPRPMGSTSSRDTFGHNGSNCCLGWADPGRRLVVCYLSNLLTAGVEGSPHQSAVSDAVLAGCS